MSIRSKRTEIKQPIIDTPEFNRRILEASPIGILTYKASGECVSANEAAARIVGATVDQLLAQNFRHFESWKRSGLFQAADTALVTGLEQKIDSYIVTTTGMEIWATALFVPFKSRDELHLLLLLVDVTERRQREEALRESEERFQQLSNSTFEAIAIHDQGILIDVNESFCKLYGYDRSEVIGKSALELTAPESRDLVLEHIRTGYDKPYEGAALRKDGTRFEVELVGRPIQYQGRLVRVTAIRDITERKRVEETSVELSRLLEESLNEIYVFDADTLHFIQVNHGARHNLGYTIDELRTLTPLDLKPEFNAQTFAELVRPLRTREKPKIVFVTKHRRKDNSLYDVEAHLQVAKFEGRPVFVAIILDITERKRAEEKIRQIAARAEALARVAGLLNAKLDLATVLKTVCEETARALNVSAASVTLYDEEDDLLKLAATFGFPSEYRERFAPIPRARHDEQIDRKGPISVIPDIQAAPGHANGDLLIELKARTIVITNLEREGQLIGTLGLTAFEQVREFTDDELTLLEGLGDQAAQAIANARLHEAAEKELAERKRAEQEILQRNAELAALFQTGQALNRLAQPDKILEQIYSIIGQVLDNRNLYFALYDEANKAISFPVYTIDGEYQTRSSRLLRNGLTEYVLRTKAPLLISRNLPTALVELGIDLMGRPARCFLAVPILTGEKALGVIAIQDYERDDVYSTRDLELLATIASQTATALENARLFEETQRRANEFAALFETARGLATQNNLQTLLDTIVERAQELLSAKNGFMYLYDAAHGELELQVARGFQGALGTRLQIGEGMAGRVGQTRQPLLVEDYQTWEGRSPKYETVPYRAIIEVPMLVGGELIGVLGINEVGESLRQFTERDSQLLSLFASQAASAVHHARLLAETKRRADEFAALYETTRDLTMQQDMQTAMETVLERALALLGVSSGSLTLYDPAKGDLFNAAVKNTLIPLGGRFKLGEGSAGRAALTRQPVIVDDFKTWEFRIRQFEDSPYGTGLAVPMLFRGELIGAVSVREFRERSRKFTEADARLLSLFASQAAAAVNNARLLDETNQRAEQLALLYDAGLALNSVLEPRAQIENLLKIASKTLRTERAEFFRFDQERHEIIFELGIGYDEKTLEALRNSRFAMGEEKSLAGWMVQHRRPLYLPDVSSDPRYTAIDPAVKSGLWIPIVRESQLNGILSVLSTRVDAFTPQDERLMTLFANQVAVAMENARLFEETTQRLAEISAVNKISTSLRAAQTLEEMIPLLLQETLTTLGTDAGSIRLIDPASKQLHTFAAFGWFNRLDPRPFFIGEGIVGHVFSSGESYVTREFAKDTRLVPSTLPFIPEGWGGTVIPIRTTREIIGVVSVSVKLPREITTSELRFLTTIAEIAGNAIQRMRLNEKNLVDARRLAALHAIDMAISSNFDLRSTLNILLEQVIDLLQVDAADVLLLNPHTMLLEYAVGLGFRSRAIAQSRLRLGEGYAGRAALERRTTEAPDLREVGTNFARAKLLAGEDFVTYYGVPLIAKGQVVGVLDLFNRTRLAPDKAWLDFMHTLAGQAAIAIDSANLFVSLQRSNIELGLAYDTTLEGWSHALDLRDKETEGHTQRVTEMTLRLARALGMKEEDFVQIHRGGLLHDIGKMGIPDSILHKPGPLTEPEWEIMRRHPALAFELLSPIDYLRPALEIPYCHHEKWDGTGYPRGLKGEQIPLAARIFAVVDVWDALTSDRPYRKAWSKEKTRDYIRAESGKHFDPRVVEEFLKLIEEGRSEK